MGEPKKGDIVGWVQKTAFVEGFLVEWVGLNKHGAPVMHVRSFKAPKDLFSVCPWSVMVIKTYEERIAERLMQ